MKTLTFILSSILLLQTAQAAPKKPAIPDIPPDAPSSMYQAVKGLRLISENDGLDSIVSLGERNLNWLKFINSFRPANDKISFTSKSTTGGIPIDKPSEYNPTLIQQKLDNLKPQIPMAMQEVLFNNAEFTKEPPVDLADYINYGRLVDRVYQSALRWRMMAAWLPYLAERRHNDLRGWYHLSRMTDRAEKLNNFTSLDEETKANLRGWLIGVCFNDDESDNTSTCAANIDGMVARGQSLEDYYESKAGVSENLFRGYFRIPEYAPRREIHWEEFPTPHLVAPFRDPMKDDVRAFLTDNILDEWRFGNWKLELPFTTTEIAPRVVFEFGATPHVNGLGGDTITMNGSQPLTEYDAQWTIRHEYGHVLGLPDCYVEFYEAERNVIVNYQFDIDNLMCSRHGHIQQSHVDELKRVYLR